MKPSRRIYSGLIDDRRNLRRAALAALTCVALASCEQNTYVPPPPPKVDVANPVQRSITRYLEATGNTAAIKSVDLVARVQGFLETINYRDGTFQKEGTTLFTIEPETYKLKLEQAQAAEAGAQATVKQAEADFKRQSDLVARQAARPAASLRPELHDASEDYRTPLEQHGITCSMSRCGNATTTR